jgi:hypothetical protein
VSISGFVFAPNFQKREYLREIDAVLQGATFVKDGAPSVATTD